MFMAVTISDANDVLDWQDGKLSETSSSSASFLSLHDAQQIGCSTSLRLVLSKFLNYVRHSLESDQRECEWQFKFDGNALKSALRAE